MQLSKIIRNEPIKNFICVYKEENGIKHARVAQKCIHRAKYCQLTRAEIKAVLGNPNYTHIEQLKTDNWILEREKDWNLASIYYHEVNGVKEVIDIHYHKNGNKNGHRTEQQVIEDTNAILEEYGFKLNLFIGGFMTYKKQVQLKTNKHTVKRYTKIN